MNKKFLILSIALVYLTGCLVSDPNYPQLPLVNIIITNSQGDTLRDTVGLNQADTLIPYNIEFIGLYNAQIQSVFIKKIYPDSNFILLNENLPAGTRYYNFYDTLHINYMIFETLVLHIEAITVENQIKSVYELWFVKK